MIRLGKYEILQDLTRGAFGKIYRGIDIYTGERVAIKTESIVINSLKNEAKIYNYLNNNRIPYNLIDIDYLVILSLFNTIAVTGDSGSGKTTITKI